MTFSIKTITFSNDRNKTRVVVEYFEVTNQIRMKNLNVSSVEKYSRAIYEAWKWKN